MRRRICFLLSVLLFTACRTPVAPEHKANGDGLELSVRASRATYTRKQGAQVQVTLRNISADRSVPLNLVVAAVLPATGEEIGALKPGATVGNPAVRDLAPGQEASMDFVWDQTSQGVVVRPGAYLVRVTWHHPYPFGDVEPPPLRVELAVQITGSGGFLTSAEAMRLAQADQRVARWEQQHALEQVTREENGVWYGLAPGPGGSAGEWVPLGKYPRQSMSAAGGGFRADHWELHIAYEYGPAPLRALIRVHGVTGAVEAVEFE